MQKIISDGCREGRAKAAVVEVVNPLATALSSQWQKSSNGVCATTLNHATTLERNERTDSVLAENCLLRQTIASALTATLSHPTARASMSGVDGSGRAADPLVQDTSDISLTMLMELLQLPYTESSVHEAIDGAFNRVFEHFTRLDGQKVDESARLLQHQIGKFCF